MTLSVVIPAHGREDLLLRCLTSLKHDVDGDFDCEVCVVDDGSGLDGDAVRMKLAAGESFIWRSFDRPRGRAAARNKGIRSTTGDIVVFLDSDMEIRRGFLRSHLEHHRAHPHTAVIGRILWPKGGSFLRYIGTRGVAKLKPGDAVPPWYFVTGNASVERADLPGGKAFDETLPGWGGEDLELGMRLAGTGVRFLYAPDAVSLHHFTGSLAEHVVRTERYGRETLPLLVGRYPELEHVLRLDLLESRSWRSLVHTFFFAPVLAAARVLDPLPLPDILFDYLTFAAYARGWLEGKRRQASVPGATKKRPG